MPRTPIHPGEILGDELQEIALSASRLAEMLEVPPNRLYQIIAGKRNVTADTVSTPNRNVPLSSPIEMSPGW